MSEPRLLTKSGKTTECAHPREGLIHPVVQQDGRHGSSMMYIAPRGEITAVSETDKSLLMTVNVPIIFLPNSAKGVDTKFMEEQARKLIEKARKNLIADLVPRAKFTPAATVGEGDLFARETLTITEAYDAMYQICNTDDYERCIDVLTAGLETDIALPSSAIFRPIGLAAVMTDSDGGYNRLLRPRAMVNIQDNWMYLELPKITLSMTQMRIASRAYVLLKTALDMLIEDHFPTLVTSGPVDTGVMPGLTDNDAIRYGSIGYLLGAYAGWDAKFDMNIEYTGTAHYEKILPYLPLPFAEALPRLTLNREGSSFSDAVRDLMMFNIILGLVISKVGGGALLPMQYRASRANVYFVKQEVLRAIRPVYELGGSSTPFMPIPTTKSLINGHYVPYMMDMTVDDKKFSTRWEAPVTLEGEKFADLEVDRGRAVLDTSPSAMTNMRLKLSRDGYVDKFTYLGHDMMRIVTPKIRDEDVFRDHMGLFGPGLGRKWPFTGVASPIFDLEFLACYWTGPDTAPKYAVGITLPREMSSVNYRTVYRGGETVLIGAGQFGPVERVLVPGETAGGAKAQAGVAASSTGAPVDAIKSSSIPDSTGGVAPRTPISEAGK